MSFKPIHENMSWFRRWVTADILRGLTRPVFIHKGKASKPLAVVVPYEHFVTMQGAMRIIEKEQE